MLGILGLPLDIQNKSETGEKWTLEDRRLLSDSSQKMGWHAQGSRCGEGRLEVALSPPVKSWF